MAAFSAPPNPYDAHSSDTLPTGLYNAFNNMALNNPGGGGTEWFLDTGAMAHMASNPGCCSSTTGGLSMFVVPAGRRPDPPRTASASTSAPHAATTAPRSATTHPHLTEVPLPSPARDTTLVPPTATTQSTAAEPTSAPTTSPVATTSTSAPSPPPAAQPPRHHMVTRAQHGIRMPNPKYAHLATTSQPTTPPTSVRAAMRDP
ncbi:platelet glycoprotein Ib alpha chain-like [Sorghum bicolor]|uniref:platelet glycoprotein Ib alpha chain-like n=1 Tax=Sorghum bicolor TaxID=4558 RepID=UPI000B4248CE|nr:platelet glycoprotein Ib alpha chain-like [Sorghum bicolor]|eukprot:XP_021309031.1 platelet glycoprotein Ib alpha chain-like [Sorghum bicolor]